MRLCFLTTRYSPWIRFATCLLALACILNVSMVGLAVAAAGSHDAAALRGTYAMLVPQLQSNAFQRQLIIDSTEASGALAGEVYAVIDYPFATVNAALSGPEHWCDMLILHLNTKYCRADSDHGQHQLHVSIGTKHDQPLADAYRVNFSFAAVASTADYMDVVLRAKDGPMGTSEYRIQLEAVSLPENRTFMHLTYSYAYGMAARIAMQAYLSTVGSGKIGFTQAGNKANGKADYIGGVRGVVERNTMRYYLAVDAYLSAIKAPASEQLERRLQAWFGATERFPRQLHEVERSEYLEMKRREFQRQQTAQ